MIPTSIVSAGWTPIMAVEADGDRRILKIVDWVAGDGPKPRYDVYVGPDGLTRVKAEAVDIRGHINPTPVDILHKLDTDLSNVDTDLTANEKTTFRGYIDAATDNEATQAVRGLMSAADKTKLDKLPSSTALAEETRRRVAGDDMQAVVVNTLQHLQNTLAAQASSDNPLITYFSAKIDAAGTTYNIGDVVYFAPRSAAPERLFSTVTHDALIAEVQERRQGDTISPTDVANEAALVAFLATHGTAQSTNAALIHTTADFTTSNRSYTKGQRWYLAPHLREEAFMVLVSEPGGGGGSAQPLLLESEFNAATVDLVQNAWVTVGSITIPKENLGGKLAILFDGTADRTRGQGTLSVQLLRGEVVVRAEMDETEVSGQAEHEQVVLITTDTPPATEDAVYRLQVRHTSANLVGTVHAREILVFGGSAAAGTGGSGVDATARAAAAAAGAAAAANKARLDAIPVYAAHMAVWPPNVAKHSDFQRKFQSTLAGLVSALATNGGATGTRFTNVFRILTQLSDGTTVQLHTQGWAFTEDDRQTVEWEVSAAEFNSVGATAATNGIEVWGEFRAVYGGGVDELRGRTNPVFIDFGEEDEWPATRGNLKDVQPKLTQAQQIALLTFIPDPGNIQFVDSDDLAKKIKRINIDITNPELLEGDVWVQGYIQGQPGTGARSKWASNVAGFNIVLSDANADAVASALVASKDEDVEVRLRFFDAVAAGNEIERLGVNVPIVNISAADGITDGAVVEIDNARLANFQGLKIWYGTKAQFDALAAKDASTIYYYPPA